jgi:metallophosphoesterase (TIGR03767 family)
VVLATSGCLGGGGPAAPTGSTRAQTFVDANGDGVLERGPGEALVDRTTLAPASAPVRELARFAQITDAHVVDEESPSRVEFLDRLGPPFTSAFRPQEALTGQVLAAAVSAVNRFRPGAVVVTGDLVDNDQQNELDEALAVLRGGRVDPNSGRPGYTGVQAPSDPDPFYYRPAVDPPQHPGLLAAAERPFRSAGLRAPWYPVLGNHDALVQGTAAPVPETKAIAVGGRKVVALAGGALAAAPRALGERAAIRAVLAAGLPGRAARVAPDPRRRELSSAEAVRRLVRGSGHGALGRFLDYAFDLGPRVRGIVLDTTRRESGAGGLLRPAQLQWLRGALGRAGSRSVVVFSHAPLDHTDGGEQALDLLGRDPHVVAAVAGHLHRNEIRPRRGAAGGFWLVQTSSLADYPQQARAFRLVSTRDGGVALQTWMIDHDSTPLAAVSRELAYLDFQGGRPARFVGRPSDRNATLYLRRVSRP